MRKIKIITQNCFLTIPKKEISALILKEQADIYCFQEITSLKFVEYICLKANYNFASSRPYKSLRVLRFHNVILSKYPIVESGEFTLMRPKTVKNDIFSGKVAWSIIKSKLGPIKVFNCHFNPFHQGIEERSQMLKLITFIAKKYPGPVVICGDMNTIVPHGKPYRKIIRLWSKFPVPNADKLGEFAKVSEKYYFFKTAAEAGFQELADINQSTWRMLVVMKHRMQLKLDWMLYRNLQAVSCELGPWIGDHRAIIGELKV